MRVAIVTGGYFPILSSKGGAVETLCSYIIEQNDSKRTLDFVVYSCDDVEARTAASAYTSTDFEFIRIPSIVRGLDKAIYAFAKKILRKKKHLSYRYIIQRLYFIRKVGLSLARHPVERIVFENSPTLLLSLRVSGNKLRYNDKYLYHMHNVVPGFFGCEEELLGCRRIIGVSDYALREMQKSADGKIDETRMVVLRNRVDEVIFSGNASEERLSELRVRHGIPEDSRIVLFGGRLTKEKGALELVRAFARVESKDVILLVLGSYYYGSGMKSEYEDLLDDAAKALGNQIVFTGFIDHAEMPDYYALADVVCAPSIWSDSAPLAVIEPLTAGRPVITTQMGGIPEYATNGVDAVVLPVDENLIEGLAAAIDGVLDGGIMLQRNKEADWHVSGFYDNFVRVVRE